MTIGASPERPWITILRRMRRHPTLALTGFLGLLLGTAAMAEACVVETHPTFILTSATEPLQLVAGDDEVRRLTITVVTTESTAVPSVRISAGRNSELDQGASEINLVRDRDGTRVDLGPIDLGDGKEGIVPWGGTFVPFASCGPRATCTEAYTLTVHLVGAPKLSGIATAILDVDYPSGVLAGDVSTVTFGPSP